MNQLVRVGAVARVDPDPVRELAAWRDDLDRGRIDDPQETRRRLEAQERGDQIVVRLDTFAEFVDGGAIRRYDGAPIAGAWFEIGAEEVNLAHARELISSHLEDFHRELIEQRRIDVSYSDLAHAAVAVEIDDELARRLARR